MGYPSLQQGSVCIRSGSTMRSRANRTDVASVDRVLDKRSRLLYLGLKREANFVIRSPVSCPNRALRSSQMIVLLLRRRESKMD